MAIKESLAVMSASAAVAGGLAEMPSFATAQQQPEAVAASTTWSHLGGDPLVPGGIHSRHDFVRFVTSSKGHHALAMQGLGSKEIAALDKAAHLGKERSCTMNVGDHFKSMVFGINGTSIDRDVTFTDPRYRGRGAAAYCLDATVKNKNGSKEVIHTLTPKKCGNLAVEKIVHTKPVHKKVKLSEVSVFKHALDANDEKLFPTPTHTFQFMMRCIQKGHLIQRSVIYNSDPQPLGKCDVGKPVTVKELATLGPEQWETLSDTEQTKIVRKNAKRNLFVFKDREKKVTPPPAQCTDTMTPEQCFPKNGTEGAGAGTPGTTNTGSTVGGPGAGGQPGNETASVPCYDAADSQNGDLNPATEGEIMYVTSTSNVDQNQYCIGQAQPATNP